MKKKKRKPLAGINKSVLDRINIEINQKVNSELFNIRKESKRDKKNNMILAVVTALIAGIAPTVSNEIAAYVKSRALQTEKDNKKSGATRSYPIDINPPQQDLIATFSGTGSNGKRLELVTKYKISHNEWADKILGLFKNTNDECNQSSYKIEFDSNSKEFKFIVDTKRKQEWVGEFLNTYTPNLCSFKPDYVDTIKLVYNAYENNSGIHTVKRGDSKIF